MAAEMRQQAGGVTWYAARTRYGQEIGIRDRLVSLGIEHFIPTGKRRNYRGKMREYPLINNLVFVRATKRQACDLKVYDGLPVNWIFDYVNRTMLSVPDKQMDDFRKVVEASVEEGGLVDRPLSLGERVRVTTGPLKGVEGFVLELQGAYYVVVSLCGLVYARSRIPRAWLEKVNE